MLEDTGPGRRTRIYSEGSKRLGRALTDLFISYARGDHQQAGRLAAAMEAEGNSVWWDRQLLSGDEFSPQIEQALAAARAVIVCWSTEASKSRWVRDEASLAADEGKLISVSLDASDPPIGFRQYHPGR